MSKSISDVVFTSMNPQTYYRTRDVSDALFLGRSTTSHALRELARGGLVERIADGRRVIYITKQQQLF
jgi:Mn-dependent DtxR family transcriptional regulator